MSLLLLGPHETMIVVATSAFFQCNLNNRDRTPAYRTWFSMAALVITVQGAGLTFRLLGGHVGGGGSPEGIIEPLLGAATVYFFLNTVLVATAIALLSDQRIRTVWAQRVPVERSQLLHQRRGRRARRQPDDANGLLADTAGARAALPDVPQLQDLHEAHRRRAAAGHPDRRAAPGHGGSLGPGDRRERTTLVRPPVARAALRRPTRRGHRPLGSRCEGHQDRRTAARHRQARRARADSVEARTAHAGRTADDADSSTNRGRNHRRRALPISGGRRRPQSSRALERHGLSSRAVGRGDSRRRPHPRHRGLF